MIKEVKMYTVICDNCGLDSNEGGEYSCWGDEDQARMMATESRWHDTHDGKHYCDNCYSFDDNDVLTIDESRKDKYKTGSVVDPLPIDKNK